MANITPSKEALLLNTALREAGIGTELEHWDGHKHVDIYVPKAQLYIEVDGIQHYTNVRQILSDFQRDHYSDDDGFRTLRIPAHIVEDKAQEIAEALKMVIY